jgi:hypothetical protein
VSLNPEVSQVNVDDTATLLVSDESGPVGRNEDGRMTYELYNVGPDSVFLGAADVDSESGMPLPANSSRTIAFRFGSKLWGVCASGETADVRVMRVP